MTTQEPSGRGASALGITKWCIRQAEAADTCAWLHMAKVLCQTPPIAADVASSYFTTASFSRVTAALDGLRCVAHADTRRRYMHQLTGLAVICGSAIEGSTTSTWKFVAMDLRRMESRYRYAAANHR